ncbi:MAG: hypothetical protein ACTHNG_03785 [Ginsengibacter sp.]
MKKLLTLLLSAGIFSASYAQKDHGYNKERDHRNNQYSVDHRNDHDRDDWRDNGRYAQRNRSYAYQRQIQMERINREYNYKVMAIEHNRYMNRRQKRLAIRDAQRERNYRLQMLNRNREAYAQNGYGRYYDGDRR